MSDSEENSIKKALQNIEDSLNEHRMSCIVGAGFSKNAMPKFPSWNQILYPMVEEMYGDLIYQKKSIKNHIKTSKTTKEIEDEIKNEIIAEKGILQIPEDYVHYKGKREALDNYIETEIEEYSSSKIDLSTHEALLELSWEDVITTNWDNLLEKANENIPAYKKYKKVISAKELVKPPRKRIIKIHGSFEKNKYPFDNSFKHKYIVSQDDFATYHTEHEDFSNFMRVKILENSLCLFGFSGNDPNFRYWISQLRKTMTRGGNTKDSNEIYLIDYSDVVNNDDEMFYENNYITRLSIKDIKDYLVPIKERDYKYDTEKNEFQNLFNFWQTNSSYKGDYVEFYHHNFELFSYDQFITLDGLNVETKDILQTVNVTEWKDINFVFLYEFCMNNFYSLEDVLGKNEERIDDVIDEYLRRLRETARNKILIEKFKKQSKKEADKEDEKEKEFISFSELILKYYRENKKKKDFESLCRKLKNIDYTKYIVKYQKALYHFQKFDYKGFKKLSNELLAEADKNTEPLFFVRVVALQFLLDSEPFKLEENEAEKFLLLFKKAMADAKSKQLSYFIYLFEQYIKYKNPSFWRKAVLDNRLQDLKGDVKDIDLFTRKMELKQKLNFLEYAGLPVQLAIESNEIESYIKEAGDNKDLLLRLFLYSISFYGHSADESELRKIAPMFLRKFDDDSLRIIFDSTFAAIKTKLNVYKARDKSANTNPKLYIYLISEVIKRMNDKSYTKEFLKYFFKKLEEKDPIVNSGVRKGRMWGWKGPFLYFIMLNEDSETYTWLLEYVMDEYLADKEEILAKLYITSGCKASSEYKGFISPSEYYDYYLSLVQNYKFKTEQKAFFARPEVQKKLKEDFNLQKELCLESFNYLNDELKQKVSEFIESSYTDRMHPYYMRYVKTEKAKEHCFCLLLNYDFDSNISNKFPFSQILLGFKEAFSNLTTADDKKSLMDSLHSKLDKKKNKQGFLFSMFATLYSEEEIQNDENLKRQYETLLVNYKQQDDYLFDYGWIYGNDKEMFATNLKALLVYASYLSEMEDVLSYLKTCLSRLLFEDSKVFESIFDDITESYFNPFLRKVYADKEISQDIELLQEKFKKEIPLCYDDVTIRKFMLLPRLFPENAW